MTGNPVRSDRPNFQRMIEGIEEGKINCVVTKAREQGKRPYQNLLLALEFGLATFIISIILIRLLG